MSQQQSSSGSGMDKWMAQRAYRLLSASAVGLVAVATTVYHFVEDWSWVDSFYFSTIAVTTVGFGDLAPTSDGSKIFTVLYVALGIGIIGTFLNERLNRHAARVADRQKGD